VAEVPGRQRGEDEFSRALGIVKQLARESKRGISSAEGRLVFRQGIRVVFESQDVRRLDEATDLVMSIPQFKRNFRRADVFRAIEGVLIESLSHEASQRDSFLEKRIDALRRDLVAKTIDWVVEIPLVNIDMRGSELQVGNCLIKRKAKKIGRRQKEILRNIEQQRIAKGYRPVTITHFEKELDENVGEVIAVVKEHGSSQIAVRAALDQARAAVDILKVYSFPNDDFYGRYIGVKGESQDTQFREIILLARDESQFSFHPEHTLIKWRFELDADRYRFLKYGNFKNLSRMLVNYHNNGFNERVVSGARWVGRALNIPVALGRMADKRDDFLTFSNFYLYQRIVGLVTALETMLLQSDEGAKGEKLGNRSARLITSNDEDRENVDRVVKDSYKRRNEILHAGRTNVSRREVEELAWICQHVVFKLASFEGRFQRVADYLEYLEAGDLEKEE